MGTQIQTNIPSLTSSRYLKMNKKKAKSSLEKLVSGFKINKSADDASGLGISEKMRAQISALGEITDGCEDGVNLLYTLDGYLNENQEMIVRMEELAMKATDGILEDKDRRCLQEEMDHLCAEIDRVADTANFNNNKLFNGNKLKCCLETYTVRSENVIDGTQYIKGIEDSEKFNQIFNEDTYVRYGLKVGETRLSDAKEANQDKLKNDTLWLLGDTITNYLIETNQVGSASAMIGMAVYYRADGKEACVLSKDQDESVIKEKLCIKDSSVAFFKVETACRYNQYDADIYNLIKDDETGEATVELCKNGVDEKKGGEDGDGLDQLVDSYVYFAKDGSGSTVQKSGASDAEIRQALNGVDYYRAKINLYERRAVCGYKEETFTRKVYYSEPIILQVGETSERPDKMPITLYDLHSNKLFQQEYDGVDEIEKFSTIETNYWEVPPTKVPTGNGGSSTTSTKVVKTFSMKIGGTADTSWGKANVSKKTITTVNNKSSYTYDYSEAVSGTRVDTVKETIQVPRLANAVKHNSISTYSGGTSIDISTQDAAIKNIDYIKNVSNKISLIRGVYGAQQNRLDYIINNHENTIENISAAKSRIKDTDMAKEYAKFTQMNILSQASQTMLAQANTQPQNVIQLLQ